MREIKTVKREVEWKQGNPRDQLVAILMAIEGHACNIGDGIPPKSPAKRIQDFCAQAQRILKNMPEGKFQA